MIYEEVVVLDRPFVDALADVKRALASEGFGTLTEIDMQAALQDKIGKEIDPYVIIGACNPHFAARALDVLPRIGVLLPCNVVVREHENRVIIEVADPHLMATLTKSDDIEPIASEARERINRVLAQLTAGW